MKNNLGIIPFTDFWVDCVFNTLISILSTKEPSYKSVACMNDYHYKIKEVKTIAGKWINFLALESLNTVSNKYLFPHFSFEPFNFKNENNYFKEIQELIIQKKILALGIDLFYWIPNSFCFNKCHWEHKSLINGVDDENRTIQVFDDDLEGFRIHEIPEERLCKAIESLEQNPHGFLIFVAKDIEPYSISLSEALFNAEVLSKELKGNRAESLLHFDDPEINGDDWFDAFTRYITQVVNRQTANVALFHCLYKQNAIHNQETISSLIQSAEDVKIGWQIIRKEIIKSYKLNPTLLNQEEFYEKCNRLFDIEYEMWGLFLDLR